MHFENIYILWLLILPLIAAFFILRAGHYRKKAFKKFAEDKFYNFFFKEFNSFNWGLKNWILLYAVVFFIIAAARPQWNKEVQMIKREGIDIVLAVDVSKSMDADDLKPSRIERAKDQISQFVSQLQGDRVAIIAFAGKSFVQCPLTGDYNAAMMFTNLLDTNTVPTLGTDIGGALNLAYSMFGESQKHKVVVLLSDGEDLEEKAVDIAEDLAEKGVRIYSLGLGSTTGTRIVETNNEAGKVYLKDEKGEFIVSKLDERTLSNVANAGGGSYYRVSPRQSEITEILNSIGKLEKNKFDSKEFVKYKDQFHWFVLIGFALLLVESIILWKKKTVSQKTI